MYLLDENDRLYRVRYHIQTALWADPETGKWEYVSIFPNFIKRYCKPCLNMLEYISSCVGKGEDILEHIDDPEGILTCEDHIARTMKRLERSCSKNDYSALLNSRYTLVYNKPILVPGTEITGTLRFKFVYILVVTARYFFGKARGVLAMVNTIIRL